MSGTPDLILWAGFAGSWLLVAGPLYQGAAELEAELRESEEFVRKLRSIAVPERMSTWWWLVPPVAYVLRRRRARRYRRAAHASLTSAEREQLLAFSEKATAWNFVAGGGALLAVGATWDLRESYGWSAAIFWLAIVGMALVCAANTVFRVRRRHRLRQGDGDGDGGGDGGGDGVAPPPVTP